MSRGRWRLVQCPRFSEMMPYIRLWSGNSCFASADVNVFVYVFVRVNQEQMTSNQPEVRRICKFYNPLYIRRIRKFYNPLYKSMNLTFSQRLAE